MDFKHYLYQHIREDTNEIFYIGVGSKSEKSSKTHKGEYARAYARAKGDRNQFWYNVVAKTKYKVEILMESDEYEVVKKMEVVLVDLYGRRNLGKGALVNLTDGGDGTLGYKPSAETKLKQSIARKGLKYTEERNEVHTASMLRGKNHPGARLMLSTQTGIFYDTIKEASKIYNISRNHLGLMLGGYIRNKTDLIYAESENDGVYPIIPEIKPYESYVCTKEYRKKVSERFKGRWVGGKSLFAKKVIKVETGVLYDCIKDASEVSNFSYANFRAKLNPNNNRANNTGFEYYNPIKHAHLLK